MLRASTRLPYRLALASARSASRPCLRLSSSRAVSQIAHSSSSNMRWATAATAVTVLALGSSLGSVSCGDGESDDAADEPDDSPKQKKFKERKILAYEHRIRMHSPPARVFRYFATKEIDGQQYMTSADLIRAIIPGETQPQGLQMDQFEKIDGDAYDRTIKLKTRSSSTEFLANSKNGLFDFSEYLFVLSLISTPVRQYEIAFKMFDLDGNGTVDIKEFGRVQQVVTSAATKGERVRDVRKRLARSPLLNFFFGAEGKAHLDFKTFGKFVADLQNELMEIEFERNQTNGKMKEAKFASLLLSYSNLSDNKDYIKRAKKRKGQEGVTKAEWVSMGAFLKAIDDVDAALRLYSAAGASVSKDDFKRSAVAVANVQLTDNLVDIIFNLFDKDSDGELSHREFIDIMKKRAQRGQDDKKSSAAYRGFKGLLLCIKDKMASDEVDQ